jgi:hypothetical protein
MASKPAQIAHTSRDAMSRQRVIALVRRLLVQADCPQIRDAAGTPPVYTRRNGRDEQGWRPPCLVPVAKDGSTVSATFPVYGAKGRDEGSGNDHTICSIRSSRPGG